MPHRFLVDSPVTTDRALLVGSEAHHLTNVLRAKPGTEVVLLDGSGVEFSARVLRIDRTAVELEIVDRTEIDRELPFQLTLGVALPKGQRQRWLIEKAVELGVTRVVPLETARGVAQPVQQALGRLRRAVVEATKQCGRTRLMKVAEPCLLVDYLREAPNGYCRLLAHPSRASVKLTGGPEPEFGFSKGLHFSLGSPVYLAVGPEGGFTGEEISAATGAEWKTVDLGPRILRIETAALALTALVAMQTSLTEQA